MTESNRRGDNMSSEVERDLKELETEFQGLNEGFRIASEKLDAIEIVLNLHYVEGDMTHKEALDEICHLVYPESRPSSEVKPE